MTGQQRYLQLIRGESRGVSASAARGGLAALAQVYGAGVRLRNWSFDAGWRKQHRLPRAVVSVGNLTAGGTGKTPVVAWLCAKLRERGHSPAVLMRGYRAHPGEKGDEQRLLEVILSDTTVQANPDRILAARQVLAAHPGVDVFVLDDGFQHRRVARDFDLVLIDATQPLDDARLLPRGLLREPIRSLRRASAVLITRAEPGEPRIGPLRDTIARHTTAPVFQSRFLVDRLLDAGGSPVCIAGRQVLAVSGIGNPAAFVQTLEKAGARVGAEARFADHHAYTADDIRRIVAEAGQLGALAVTTTKDWVKIQPLWPLEAAGELAVLEQRLEFAGDEEEDLLKAILPSLKSS